MATSGIDIDDVIVKETECEVSDEGSEVNTTRNLSTMSKLTADINDDITQPQDDDIGELSDSGEQDDDGIECSENSDSDDAAFDLGMNDAEDDVDVTECITHEVRSFSTYNLLLPFYAVKWKTPNGLFNGEDNWHLRKRPLAKLIVDCDSDVVCLQEVNRKTLNDLLEGDVSAKYTSTYSPHPGRKDGVAILFKTSEFVMVKRAILRHRNGHVSVIANLRDPKIGVVFTVISTHISFTPAGDVQLEELIDCISSGECPTEGNGKLKLRKRLIVCGDFNRTKSTIINTIVGERTGLVPNTNQVGRRLIDWVLYRRNVLEEELSHSWKDEAEQLISNAICEETKLSPSDHTLNFAVLRVT